MFWDLKGRKAIHMGIEKQFVGPYLTKGHREDFDQMSLSRFLPVCHTWFILN